MENEDIVTPATAAPTIRTVAVNRGVEWIAGGFRMFMKNPVPLAVAGLGLAVGGWLFGLIGPHWMGSALATMFWIVATGALMRAFQGLDKGVDALASAQATIGLPALWILALIGSGLSIGMNMVASVMGIGSLAAGMVAPSSVGGLIGINLMLMFAMSIALLMALWLAPALIVLRGANPAQAIRASLTASVRNIVPYIIFTLLGMIACIIGALPLGLGLIVTFPVLVFGTYLAYKDIFVAADAREGVAYNPDE